MSQDRAHVSTRSISRYPTVLEGQPSAHDGDEVFIIGGGSDHSVDVWQSGPLFKKWKNFQDRVAAEVKKANGICDDLNRNLS